jgi:hypothetical protein
MFDDIIGKDNVVRISRKKFDEIVDYFASEYCAMEYCNNYEGLCNDDTIEPDMKDDQCKTCWEGYFTS